MMPVARLHRTRSKFPQTRKQIDHAEGLQSKSGGLAIKFELDL
jgi:hypothetical protein